MGAVRCNEITFKCLAKCMAHNESTVNGRQDYTVGLYGHRTSYSGMR